MLSLIAFYIGKCNWIWKKDSTFSGLSTHPKKAIFYIEVKRSPNLGPDDIRALIAFKEEYPEAMCVVVVPGKRVENYRGFPVLPMEEFLLNISPENLIISSSMMKL